VKKFLSALSILIIAMGACAPLAAQTHVVPVYSYPSAGTPPGVILQCDANADNCTPTSVANPLVVSSSSGSGVTAGQIQGNAASGASDTGTNPVKTGCVFNTSLPTVTTGQRVDNQCTSKGEGITSLSIGGIAASAGVDNSDAQSVTGTSTIYRTVSRNYVFNGTSWDRSRGDTTGQYVVEVPSAAAAAGVAVNATSVAAGSLILKASAGNLYGYNVTSGASAGYVMIFNSATVPADGAVTPARCIPLAANTGMEVDLRGQPTFFTTGIVIVFSTTGCFSKTISATAFIAGDAK
jgi:hypothetical protein